MTDFALGSAMSQGYLVCTSSGLVNDISANLDQPLKGALDAHSLAHRKAIVHPAPSSFTVRVLPPTKQGEYYARRHSTQRDHSLS
jgi:hypothetical protein